jgi:hypothetical protein
METNSKQFTAMDINYSQHDTGQCVNEITLTGDPGKIRELVETIEQLKSDANNPLVFQTLLDLKLEFGDYFRDVSYNDCNFYELDNRTISLTLITVVPVNNTLMLLSNHHGIKTENMFYSIEENYAGKSRYVHGEGEIEIDTYYKGLYMNHPQRFWESIGNLVNMMTITKGDWEEIDKEINFCSDEDYNAIKDMFKGVLCITGDTKNN